MSSTTQPTDFSDLYTDLENRVRETTGILATENQAKRYINTALMDLHLGYGEQLWWAERSAVLRTQPSYTTGTVALTIGSTTVTGTGTAWNTANDYSVNNVRAGGKMTFGGDNVYEVASVASDTSLTLTVAYNGATDTGVSYTYFEDEYALSADFLKPLDAQRFSSPASINLIDRRTFRRMFPRNNTVGTPTVATLIAKDPSGDTTVRKRIRFHQPPSSALLIPYSFVTNKLAVSSAGATQVSLSADADEPIVPLQYRHIIVLGALYNWYRDKRDDARAGDVQQDYFDHIRRMTGDQQIGVDPRPHIAPYSSVYLNRARRPWRGGVRGRFTTGSAFDELRG